MNGKTAWSSAFLAIASVTLLSCGSGQKVRSADLPTASVYSNLGRVAFELDGDIYVKSLPDGETRRLTTSGKASYPQWSPSGEWLLLGDDRCLCLMREDGTGRHELAGTGAVWSTVDDRIAYGGLTSLFIENADGSDRYGIASTKAVPGAWSPDGKHLAYDQLEFLSPSTPQPTSEVGKTYPSGRRASLWVVDVDGSGGPTELYSSTADGIVTAGWTSDGEKVLFWRDLLFGSSMMADGLPLEAIPAQGGRPLALAAGHLALWDPSPVDERIALTSPGRETWTHKLISLVDAQTGLVQYVTPENHASIQPSWSPDGRQIAFVSKPDLGEGPGGPGWELEKMASDRRIWVMNSDGSEQRQLRDDAAYRDEHPEWSADGSTILFARLDGDRLASLWLMSSEGGAPERVVDRIESSTEGLTGYYTNIGWSGMFDWWRPRAPEERPSAPTSTLVPKETPEETSATTEPKRSERRTGIESVDAVIDALLSGDPETLRPFLRFTPIACTAASLGLGGPPLCRFGEEEGAIVDVFPVGSCEGHYLRSDEMDKLLELVTGNDAALYAVFRGAADSWPLGDYVAVLSLNVSGLGVVGEQLFITDGRLVGVHDGCGETPEQIVRNEHFDKVLLPPP